VSELESLKTSTLEGVRPRDAVKAYAAVGELPPTAKRNRPRKVGSHREKQSIARVRSAMAQLLEKNAPKFEEWLARAAEENPLKAMVLMKDLAEFYMPKLGRIEQTGTVEHKVSHFVPMIQREEPPAGYLGGKVIEGEATEAGGS
jgi:hypothetical protein